MTPIEFFAATDIVVTGTNPENADIDNPRGEIYGYAGYVVAQAANGERRRLRVCTKDRDDDALQAAQRTADALTRRLNDLKRLPVAFDRWQPYHAAYGSDAHDESELVAWERRIDEESQWG